MSRVQKFRQSMDGIFDQWQIKAETMETVFDASQEEVLDKLEVGKEAYLAVIDKVKAAIATSQSLAQAEKDRIQQKLDEARVQIALGKADTIDAFKAQHKKLTQELFRLEQEIDAEMAASEEKTDAILDQAARNLVKAANALNAQLETAAVQLLFVKDAVQSVAEEKIAQTKEDLATFKANIEAKRKDAPATLQAFEKEFTAGWNQMVSALKTLV